MFVIIDILIKVYIEFLVTFIIYLNIKVTSLAPVVHQLPLSNPELSIISTQLPFYTFTSYKNIAVTKVACVSKSYYCTPEVRLPVGTKTFFILKIIILE